MADKDEATGCGCLILLGIAGFAIYKAVNWVSKAKDDATNWASSNSQTIHGWIDTAKQIGLWTAVIIVVWIILVKMLKYRGRIKRWEKGELREFLERNSTERWLLHGESGEVGQKLSEIELSLPKAERRLREIQRMAGDVA